MNLGIVSLIKGVHSHVDATLREYSTSIGGVECKVIPPHVIHDDVKGDEGKVVAPLGRIWPKNDWWGNYWGLNVVSMKTFGLVYEGSDDVDYIADTESAVAAWNILVHDWVSVLAGTPVESIVSSTTEILWLGQRHENIASYIGRSIRVNDPKVVTVDQWEYAFACAGRGEEPPIARVLLANALRSFSTMVWRSAVIDAATATEVALSAALREMVTREGSGVIADALLDRGRMLGQLVELARKLSLEVPAEIKDHLIRPRNTVMHGGGHATEDDAERACLVAADVVGRYVDLPSDAPL